MKAKRFWGLWVCLCLAFALMPAAALAANPWDVQVGGVNMGDVDMGDGMRPVYYKNGDTYPTGCTGDLTNYNARFDQNEGKLYLKNLSITSGGWGGINASIPITIVLEEGTSNSIIITGGNGGIYGTSGTVTITGRGSLTI